MSTALHAENNEFQQKLWKKSRGESSSRVQQNETDRIEEWQSRFSSNQVLPSS